MRWDICGLERAILRLYQGLLQPDVEDCQGGRSLHLQTGHLVEAKTKVASRRAVVHQKDCHDRLSRVATRQRLVPVLLCREPARRIQPARALRRRT